MHNVRVNLVAQRGPAPEARQLFERLLALRAIVTEALRVQCLGVEAAREDAVA